jgi:DNA-binding IclR family transcriptional regulator
MCERGWIARNVHGGQIELGPRSAWLTRATPASALTAGFHAVAPRLLARHNETTCLLGLDGRDVVFIAKQETTQPVRLVTEIGRRLPAFASAAGRAMLADLPDSQVRDLHAGCELVTPTGRRLRGIGELLEILVETRRRGYADNVDETALGLHCVAVPVGPPGGVAAALTLCVPSGRMSAARRREMVPDLLAAAQALAPPERPPSRLTQSSDFPEPEPTPHVHMAGARSTPERKRSL